IAVDDSAMTTINMTVAVSVLCNDTDPDGDSLNVTSVGTPAHGTAFSPGSTISYTPEAGYTGSDSFPYTISDGHGGTSSAIVTVTINSGSGTVSGSGGGGGGGSGSGGGGGSGSGSGSNHPPVAVNDTAATTSGTTVIVSAL